MDVELIAWNNRYSVGLLTVDKQHKRFLTIINELGECISQKLIKEKGKLLFFALLHFMEEYLYKEKMLANSIDNVDYSCFREKHKQFAAKIRNFKDEYVESGSEQKFVDLYNYLKEFYPQFISYYTPSLIKILKEKGIE
ncbi:MAG: hypothetical protein PF517_20045 [Salinivirgaceae bacterium]|jgi:hemerythrin|nr:hypothetical protein [Salinivirgaceae bacterium]